MLKLKYPPVVGQHICYVPLSVIGFLADLLPVDGKPVFPSAVPGCLVLPPRVAAAPSLVSPVPDPDFSALGNHRAIASRIGTSP